jgi:hypothetical protein
MEEFIMKKFLTKSFQVVTTFIGVAVVIVSLALNVVLLKEHIENRAKSENTKSFNVFTKTISFSDREEPEEEDAGIKILNEVLDEIEYRLS